MDSELLRLFSYIDQTRSELRAAMKKLKAADVILLINSCGRGQPQELDERLRLLAGLLAVVAIFNLLEDAGEQG